MISIQLLRAVAAVMVVVFHVLNKAQNTGVIVTHPFMSGAAGVDLFFMISGFIMVYITHNKKVSIKDFLLKRVVRIIPLYWIMTTVAAIVFLLFPSMINSQNGVTTILNSYTLIPVKENILLTVAWTLRYEVLFYLIFSISLLLGSARYIACGITITTLSLLSLTSPQNFYMSFVTNPIIIEFVIGMLIYFAVASLNSNYGFLIIIGGVSLLFQNQTEHSEGIRVFFYAIPMLMVFLGMISLEGKLSASKNKLIKFTAYLGDASYSIYLSHLFTIGATYFIGNKATPNINQFIFIPVSIALSIFLGLLCYEIVEKPITKYIKSLAFAKHQK